MLPGHYLGQEPFPLTKRKPIEQVEDQVSQIHSEEGFTILSVLVAVVLVAIISLALSRNTMASMKIMRLTEINNFASNLAVSKIEEIASRASSEIDSSLDEVESNVSFPNTDITFRRTTTVTVNGDDTRTITVDVASNSSVIPTSVTFSTGLSVWE